MKEIFLLLSMMIAQVGLTADKYETLHAKELRKKLVECTDHENYDAADCYRELDLRLELERQDQLPDNQRPKFGVLGENILVEKATDLRVGIVQTEIQDKKFKELQIKDSQITYGFILGSAEGCDRTTFNVVKTTSQYVFLTDICFSKNKRGISMNTQGHLVFDRKTKSVFSVDRTSYIHGDPDPTIEWVNGTYHYRWNYTGNDKKPAREFYDFKIKSKTEVQCTRTWNDDCPIGPLEKRIVSKNPIEY